MKRHADHRSIFISYEDRTGLDLARSVRAALIELDVSCWLWRDDHPAGYVHSELARRIGDAEYICWVCTKGTIRSKGQVWEINNAFGQLKTERSWVVALDRKYVPQTLAGYFHYTAKPNDARDVVEKWVSKWRKGFSEDPSVQHDSASGSETDAVVLTTLVDESK